ncbi:MAG: hypothetical protein WCC27_08330 [Acidobacteriaceae bacterium]
MNGDMKAMRVLTGNPTYACGKAIVAAARAVAVGAFAIGALAMGAVAIGALSIRRLHAHRVLAGNIEIKSLKIQDLTVARFLLEEGRVRDKLLLPGRCAGA